MVEVLFWERRGAVVHGVRFVFRIGLFLVASALRRGGVLWRFVDRCSLAFVAIVPEADDKERLS